MIERLHGQRNRSVRLPPVHMERAAAAVAAPAKSVTAYADDRSPSPVNDRAKVALSCPPNEVQTALANLLVAAFILNFPLSHPRTLVNTRSSPPTAHQIAPLIRYRLTAHLRKERQRKVVPPRAPESTFFDSHRFSTLGSFRRSLRARHKGSQSALSW
jgi:hypothetical protein